MKADVIPLGWFRAEHLALEAAEILRVAGISSTVRGALDAPAGWRVDHREGFLLWISQNDEERARLIHRQSNKDRYPPQLCGRCGRESATTHVTAFLGGQQSSEELCSDCYRKSFGSIA